MVLYLVYHKCGTIASGHRKFYEKFMYDIGASVPYCFYSPENYTERKQYHVN